MFAPNLRRKIFGWLERLKNSAGIRLSHKEIRRRRGACPKIRRGGWRRRLRGLVYSDKHFTLITVNQTTQIYESSIRYTTVSHQQSHPKY